MPRIRSIKPEFFTDEKVSRLPLSARLTFIGLWVYVDDNGVGLDNDRLIAAVVWPLEDDFLQALATTHEDLMRLAGESLIIRYRDTSKRYLAITNWSRHQKVQHPGKSRYPQPYDDSVTCENTVPHVTLGKHSRDPHETLTPEQGAGSREQGAGSTTAQAVSSNVEVTPAAAQETVPETNLNLNGRKLCPACSAILDPDGTCFASHAEIPLELMRLYPEVSP